MNLAPDLVIFKLYAFVNQDQNYLHRFVTTRYSDRVVFRISLAIVSYLKIKKIGNVLVKYRAPGNLV